MRKLLILPPVLTIAGSDSGGGAGVQADLKTFAALETHGLSVITAITAQNPGAVIAIEPCSANIIQKQLEAIAAFAPIAAKTGMLLSAEIIKAVVAFFGNRRQVKLVVDPVMIATSGARLLAAGARQTLSDELLPLATLITPNTLEAEVLTGIVVREPEDLRSAARALHARFGCAALVKGGHLATGKTSVDLFFDGTAELLLEAPRASGFSTHGTGCTYSAAIAAHLARGEPLIAAIQSAKDFITGAIHGSRRSGKFAVLNPFFIRQKAVPGRF